LGNPQHALGTVFGVWVSTFRGERFTEIDRRIIPDHLALLTEEQGACSWEDGCGAPRLNNKKKENTMKTLQTFKAPDVIMSIRNRAEEEVSAWYNTHTGKKLKTQTQQKPLQFMPPAPPCIRQEEE